MRPGTSASSRGHEALSGHQRAAGRLRFTSRVFTRDFRLRARKRLDIDGQPWVVTEVVRNLRKFPLAATHNWLRIRPQLTLVDDVVSINRVVVFPVSKDRPVLLTAMATSQVLLTLDRDDFAGLLGSHFYGLPLMPPSEFLEGERQARRLKSPLVV